MSWGNHNGGGGWESNADPTWPTTQAAPAAEQQTINVVDTSVETNSQSIDNAGPAADNSENADAALASAAPKGASDEWTGHGQSHYNYEEFGVHDGEYDGNARVYHWNGEEGDIGPEFPELELEIFGPPDQRGEIYGPEIAK